MRDLELEAPGLVAPRLAQLGSQRLQATEEARVLLLEQQRRLAQPLDVRLRGQVQQRSVSWRNGVRTCGEVGGASKRRSWAAS